MSNETDAIAESIVVMEAMLHREVRVGDDGCSLVTLLLGRDIPSFLLGDRPGQRYQLVMQPIDDAEEPRIWKKNPYMECLAQAHAVCQDRRFQDWAKKRLLEIHGVTEEFGPAAAKGLIYDHCGIESRKELEDTVKRTRFYRLMMLYRAEHGERGSIPASLADK